MAKKNKGKACEIVEEKPKREEPEGIYGNLDLEDVERRPNEDYYGQGMPGVTGNIAGQVTGRTDESGVKDDLRKLIK